MIALFALCVLGPSDLGYLHQVAREVTAASRVAPGGEISNGGKNTTGFAVRVPGGTQTYYPAFWVRDAAMMLGADLVPADEIGGWIKVVAATQPGPNGLTFDHGLTIPPYSIPDHITLGGDACWFPGAYANQGVGDFGFLPPADDAFYFIQMVAEEQRLTREPNRLRKEVRTGWGEHPLYEVCAKAFDSVAVDSTTGLVYCNAEKGKTRVDWGFCDSIKKTGSCLMPSLLRWEAAKRLGEMFDSIGLRLEARQYRKEERLIQKNIVAKFYRPIDKSHGLLLSATGLGRKDDVWASAFAVWLGVLPKAFENRVSRHLLDLYRFPGTVMEGQVRAMPPTGQFGGEWEEAKSSPGTYQNGGYWATPTGWLVAALEKVDRKAASQLLAEYAAYVQAHRKEGAPFEWINPQTHKQANGNYCSSAGLVYVSLVQAGFRG